MTATIQEQIRSYVKTQLVSNTNAGTSVFDSRVTEFQDDELPAINIWLFDESLDDQKDGYSQFHKTMATPLEVVFAFNPSGEETAGTERDQLRKQIQDRLDRHLGGLVTLCEYDNTQTFVDVEGIKPTVTAVMTFNIEFIDQ